MIAYQAQRRAALAVLDPRPRLASLAGCTVEAIPVATAAALIVQYEWLGTMNRKPLACYGLLSPTRELLGAVAFGRVGSPEAHDSYGPEHRAQVIALERGASVHWAPRNAASFLIRHACRLAARDHGWRIFLAYGDPAAGEIGTVYQAVGWKYLGQGLGRRHGYREEFRQPAGTVFHSERILRHHGLTKAQALARGWHHQRRAPKHVYVWFEGPFVGRCRYAFQPYPKRVPRSRRAASVQARAHRTCLVCADVLPARRRTRTTCSDACRVKLWRDRHRAGPRRAYMVVHAAAPPVRARG